MNNTPKSIEWVAEELEKIEKNGLRRRLVHREGSQGSTIHVGGKRFVNFSSNDYLGLAHHPNLIAAAEEAARRTGWGAGASPLVTGRSHWHDELERRLAALEGTEAALLFPSGFAANAGVIPALIGEQDALFTDAKNHASIIDGCRLSRAKRFVYAHADASDLERRLAQAKGFRRRLIVTDTLFSMDGDLAPLGDLSALAERYDAMLMVDEAHATGVFGDSGRGVVEAMAERDSTIEGQVAVRVGTLSKALGSAGGFVCGSQALIDYLANRARSYVFSTAQPAPTAAAALAAIDLVQQEPERRRRVLRRAAELRLRLREAGWDTGTSASQIVPILLGEVGLAMRVAQICQERGLLAPPIRPPSVPEGEALLRISLSSDHSDEHVEALLASLEASQRS